MNFVSNFYEVGVSMDGKERRKISQDILNTEKERNNLNVSALCISRIDYFNSKYFFTKVKNDLKKFNIQKICSRVIKPIFAAGYDSQDPYDEEIIIFCGDMPSMFHSDSIINILFVTYHEIYHSIEFNTDKSSDYSYDYFASYCDKLIYNHSSFIDRIKYNTTRKGHDANMFEILASLYGAKKAYEYVEEKNIRLNRDEYIELKELNKKYNEQYKKYDLTSSLKIIIKNYNKFYSCLDFDDKIFGIFLNRDGSTKDINSIRQDKNYKLLDPKIVDSFNEIMKLEFDIKNSKVKLKKK